MKLLAIIGSRDDHGQTARATDALLAGAAKAGGEVERRFLPTMHIESCRQCDSQGWGLCRTDGACVIEDDFAATVAAIAAADVTVFATPVYYGDLSESMKAFTDRLRRICTHPGGREKIEGRPALGVCVAGGGGGGSYRCAEMLQRVLHTIGLDVLDIVPVRRQNLTHKFDVLNLTGQWLTTR